MKKIQMYSFFDKKSDRFDTPFYVFDEIGAKRHLHMSVVKKGTLMNTFREDYCLYKLADFDIVTGELELDRKYIMDAKEIQIKQED